MKNILSIMIHLISKWLVVSDHKDYKFFKENEGVGFEIPYKNSTAVTIKRLNKLYKMLRLLYKEW